MAPERELVTQAQSNLCWWQKAAYSLTLRCSFRSIERPDVTLSLCFKEAAELSGGVLPIRPLASFVCETLRGLGFVDLNFDAAVRELRSLLPGVTDDEPVAPAAAGAPHGR